MEILQTIWSALTTENVMLIKIISAPMLVLELTVSMILFTYILNISVNKKQKILYVLILSLIGLVTSWTIPVPYNTFINVIACPILVYFLFKTNLLKAIVAEIIPYIFFVILGSLILNTCVNLLQISSDVFMTIPIAKLLCSLIMYLLAYLVYKLFNRFNINITLIEALKKDNKFTLIANIIIRNCCYCNAVLFSHFI